MVSEDSDQLGSGLAAIHRLRDLRDVRQAQVGLVDTGVDQRDATSELLEVSLLG